MTKIPLSVTVLAIVLALFSSTATAGTFTSKILKGPYLIYDNDNTAMRVLWQTDGSPSGTVEWGTSTAYGASANLVS